MPNACFRCKSTIASGATFCGRCRETVTLEPSYDARNSRLWVVVAAVPLFQLLLFVGLSVRGVVSGAGASSGAFAAAAFSFPLALAFAYALSRDARHVRYRNDTDWRPSKGIYLLFVGASLLVVPSLPIAAYHLRRRERAIGLTLDRTI